MSNNNNNNNNNDNQDPSTPNGINSRPIFTLTMDPNALEDEIDQATQALHSRVNSLLNTMQSSVFGGLEHLSREMSALEKTSRTYLEENPLEKMVEKHVWGHHAFPWSLRTDGPKKRYRITIEELPPLTEAEIQEQKKEAARKVLSTTTTPSSSSAGRNGMEGHDGEDFTITQGKVGTVDEGKTVITTTVAPGLLDWLLFTTHEDSFFRRLGSGAGTPDSLGQGATLQELKDEPATINDGAVAEEEGQKGGRGRVPALVEKVKQVGSSWEKDARNWWQRKRSDDDGQSETSPSSSSSMIATDQQHHLFSGTSQSEQDQEEERLSHRWPRGRSWERSESFSQTTVTRPDGTVEHRTVNTLNGETETVVKIRHPDGSIEETVTRQGNGRSHHDDHREGSQRLFQRNNGDGRNEEYEEDRERDVIAAVVAEAISTEKAAEFEKQQQREREQQEGNGRSWPPKAWTRRQGRDE